MQGEVMSDQVEMTDVNGRAIPTTQPLINHHDLAATDNYVVSRYYLARCLLE